MVLFYEAADQSGRLSQGEILVGLEERLSANVEGQAVSANSTRIFTVVPHDTVIVVTPDCDLLGDFFYRFCQDASSLNDKDIRARQSNLLSHVLCCEVYEQVEFKKSIAGGSDIWRRIEKNQDERYHHIPSGQTLGQLDNERPDFFLDFKRVFSISTEDLYKSLESAPVLRRGVLPTPWILSLVSRLFNFQGRVCLPDPSDNRQLVTRLALFAGSQPTALPGSPTVP